MVVFILFLMVLLPLGTFFAAGNSSTDELNEHSAITENLLQDLSENPVVSNVYDAHKKVIDKVSDQPIVQQAYTTVSNSSYIQPALSSSHIYLSIVQQQGILFANMVNSQQQSIMTSQQSTVSFVQQILGI